MRLVKLTQVGQPVFVNPARVLSVTAEGAGSSIAFGEGRLFPVDEPPETAVGLLDAGLCAGDGTLR
jgi:hypothetical protein